MWYETIQLYENAWNPMFKNHEVPFLWKDVSWVLFLPLSGLSCFWHFSNKHPTKNKITSNRCGISPFVFPEFISGFAFAFWVFHHSQWLRLTELVYCIRENDSIVGYYLWPWFCRFCFATSFSSSNIKLTLFFPLVIFWNFSWSLFIAISPLMESVLWGLRWMRKNLKCCDTTR